MEVLVDNDHMQEDMMGLLAWLVDVDNMADKQVSPVDNLVILEAILAAQLGPLVVFSVDKQVLVAFQEHQAFLTATVDALVNLAAQPGHLVVFLADKQVFRALVAFQEHQVFLMATGDNLVILAAVLVAKPGHLVVFLVDKQAFLALVASQELQVFLLVTVDNLVDKQVFPALVASQDHQVSMLVMVDSLVILAAILVVQPGHSVVFLVDMLVFSVDAGQVLPALVALQEHQVWLVMVDNSVILADFLAAQWGHLVVSLVDTVISAAVLVAQPD